MATHIEQVRVEKVAVRQGWAKIKHAFEQLIKAISKVVSVDEDAIFKSRDWPYLWPKK